MTARCRLSCGIFKYQFADLSDKSSAKWIVKPPENPSITRISGGLHIFFIKEHLVVETPISKE